MDARTRSILTGDAEGSGAKATFSISCPEQGIDPKKHDLVAMLTARSL
ncbi:MAG: hypothetical protein WCL50_03465 [Spirochaetota bacterium]